MNNNENSESYIKNNKNIESDNSSIDANNDFPNTSLQESSLKYDKIVQDYVKLKSKLSILKKAYIEISEITTKKDQAIRKYEQEIEGLNFRNQQLTYRVEILQKDLEDNKVINMNGNTSTSLNQSDSSILNNNKHPNSQISLNSNNIFTLPSSASSSTISNSLFNNTSTDSSHSNSRFEILAEELQYKINENTTLHRKLNDMEIDFGQKLAKNEQTLKQIEYEKLILEKKLETHEKTSKSSIEKLQNEKNVLELSVIKLENQLRSIHYDKEMKENELKKENEELKQQHRLLSNSSSSLPPIDTQSIKSQNETLIENQQKNENLFISFIQNLIDSLQKLYGSIEERSNLSPDQNTLSKIASKCGTIINQLLQFESNLSKSVSTSIDNLLNDFFEANRNLIQTAINEISNTNNKDSKTNTNNEMDVIKKKLKIYLSKLNNLFFSNSNEANFCSILLQLIKAFFNKTISSPLTKEYSSLASNLNEINDILEKLLFVYGKQLSIEYESNYPLNLTTIDECILSYMNQFKQSISQIILLVNESNIVEVFLQKHVISKSNNNDANEVEKISADAYLNIQNELEELKKINSKKEHELNEIKAKYENLIQTSKQNLDDLEQNNLKLEKLQKEFSELKIKDDNHLIELDCFKKQLETLKINNQHKESEETYLSEQMKNFGTEQEKIIEVYVKQIANLKKRIEYLDSKAFYFYDEMKCMLRRLKIQIESNELQEKELNEIKDQLERTRSSYEIQMSTMSDHILAVTDKMAKQAEENERLKHDLNATLTMHANENINKNSSKNNSKTANKKK